jgi:hypothetical protein
MGEWVTNLESKEHMALRVSTAEEAVKSAPDQWARKAAEARLYRERYIQADVAKAMADITMRNGGRVSIGPPHPTQDRTSEQIAADGIIGIYKQGAGDGEHEAFEKGSANRKPPANNQTQS